MNAKRPKSPRSVEIISGNDDLLLEIILLLPPKTLVRFQSVSRHWQSLIFAASFGRQHTRLHHCRRPKPQPSFLLRNVLRFFYFNPRSKHFFPFNFTSPHTRILQSSNGLLLVESRNSPYGRRDYLVCNPTTRQARKLSIDHGSEKRKKAVIFGLCLAFDPSKSPYYNVVCLKGAQSSTSNYRVEVYNSESQTWKVVGENSIAVSVKLCNGIYWNEGIYWIRPTSRSLYLDLRNGNLGNPPGIRTPWRKAGEINKNYIMESNGHFHCLAMYLRPDMKYLIVFELLADGSGWFEKYWVDLNPIAGEMNGPVGVMGIVRGEREEESSVLFHVPGKIISHRLCDGSFEVVLDLTRDRIYVEHRLQFQRNDAYQFIETLAPV
ncbi:F-box protein At5g07610-like [Sesamum indicum]|uniref:F-box protein At5g07610-like n=1 Tax=Sesamum indicum TaxID=4182 RepID=A0A6I9SKH5_SESIN|nr:F-box protein At5g07610-like [Sesamum indicum]